MRRDYEILFGSLSLGVHKYKFLLDDGFFKEYGTDLVEGGDVNVLLKVDKTNTHMDLEFVLKGSLKTVCDVCLSELVYPVNHSYYLHVKFAEESRLEEDEILYLSFNEYKLDISAHLYDFTLLSLPMKRICIDSVNRNSCDKQVLDKLEDTENTDAQVHPEMEKLKGLFTKE